MLLLFYDLIMWTTDCVLHLTLVTDIGSVNRNTNCAVAFRHSDQVLIHVKHNKYRFRLRHAIVLRSFEMTKSFEPQQNTNLGEIGHDDFLYRSPNLRHVIYWTGGSRELRQDIDDFTEV